jgi:hypothetical protein
VTEPTPPADQPRTTLHEALTFGITSALADFGATLSGVTPAGLTGHIINRLRAAGLHLTPAVGDVPTPAAPVLDPALDAPTTVGLPEGHLDDLRDEVGRAMHVADARTHLSYEALRGHYERAADAAVGVFLARFLAYETEIRDWRAVADEQARQLRGVLDIEDAATYLTPWPALIARVTELATASVAWGVERDELIADLAAARGWQPIATAPRDGRVVRLCWDDTAGAGLYATWETNPDRWLTTNGRLELDAARWWQPVTPHPGPPADKAGRSRPCDADNHACPGFYGGAHTPDAPDFLCVCPCHDRTPPATATADPKDTDQ